MSNENRADTATGDAHGDAPSRVIVVGAGSSGSVISRRLVDAGVEVIVLEAGNEDVNPAIHDPSRAGELWHSSDDWDYFTVPQPHAGGRRMHLPRGKVLGGSHALNAMIWVRGAASDYDHWAALGNNGWAWNDVLPIYRFIERFSGGASAVRGDRGLLDVTDDYPLEPLHTAIIDAAVDEGLPRNDDYNFGELDGVSQEQVTMRDSRRMNTWMAYLQPVRDRVDLRLGCHVHELLYAADDQAADSQLRVVGVRYEQHGELHEVFADEVVLAAGAIDSPRVLLRSGIGPAEELAELGIASVVDLPGVGRNLHDHLLAPVIFTTQREIGAPPKGVSPTQSHLFWRSRDGLDAPDTQPIHFSVPMYQSDMEGPADGFSLMAGMIAPRSRGSIRLSGAEPSAPLLIDLDALEHEDDLASLVESVRQCRRIGARPALAGSLADGGWGAVELYPGVDIGDGDDLVEYVRSHAVTYHHQVGTCAMGIGPEAVVSPRLRVHGIDGLRVADASIMPRVPSGNTNAPSVLIGEQAASFVLSGA